MSGGKASKTLSTLIISLCSKTDGTAQAAFTYERKRNIKRKSFFSQIYLLSPSSAALSLRSAHRKPGERKVLFFCWLISPAWVPRGKLKGRALCMNWPRMSTQSSHTSNAKQRGWTLTAANGTFTRPLRLSRN